MRPGLPLLVAWSLIRFCTARCWLSTCFIGALACGEANVKLSDQAIAEFLATGLPVPFTWPRGAHISSHGSHG